MFSGSKGDVCYINSATHFPGRRNQGLSWSDTPGKKWSGRLKLPLSYFRAQALYSCPILFQEKRTYLWNKCQPNLSWKVLVSQVVPGNRPISLMAARVISWHLYLSLHACLMSLLWLTRFCIISLLTRPALPNCIPCHSASALAV